MFFEITWKDVIIRQTGFIFSIFPYLEKSFLLDSFMLENENFVYKAVDDSLQTIEGILTQLLLLVLNAFQTCLWFKKYYIDVFLMLFMVLKCWYKKNSKKNSIKYIFKQKILLKNTPHHNLKHPLRSRGPWVPNGNASTSMCFKPFLASNMINCFASTMNV